MKNIFLIIFLLSQLFYAQTFYQSQFEGAEIDSSIDLTIGDPYVRFVGTQTSKYPLTATGLKNAIASLDSGEVFIAYPGIWDTTGLGALKSTVTLNGWILGKYVRRYGTTSAFRFTRTGNLVIGNDYFGATDDPRLYLATSGAENFFLSDTYFTSANGGGFALGHSRGTSLAPVGLSAGDNCGSFYWRGMRSNGTWTNVARIQVVTEQALTTSAIGSYMGFEVGSTGTASRLERMRIAGSGFIGIGTTVPNKQLEINSSTGNNLRLTYNDNNGSAANYSDFSVSSTGDLTIGASGGQIILPMVSDSTQCTTGQLWFNSTTGAIHRKF